MTLSSTVKKKWFLRSRIDTEATRSFNDPSTAANFDKWLKFDSWDVNEAVALSLGRDPSKVKWKRDIAPYSGISRVAKEFCRRRDLLGRAVHADLLNFKMAPTAFVDWAISKKLSLPAALVAITKREPVKSESQVDESKDLLIIDALREVLGIDAEISPEEEYEEPELEAESTDEAEVADEAEATDEAEVISLKLRQTSDANLSEQEKSNRVLRSFVSVAQHLEVRSATYAKWIEIADWYCFEVIGRHIGKDDQVAGGDSSTHSADEGDHSETYCWVVPAQEHALAAIKLFREEKKTVTQVTISVHVSAVLFKDRYCDKHGNPIAPKYILRKALSPKSWWKIATSERQEKKEK